MEAILRSTAVDSAVIQDAESDGTGDGNLMGIWGRDFGTPIRALCSIFLLFLSAALSSTFDINRSVVLRLCLNVDFATGLSKNKN